MALHWNIEDCAENDAIKAQNRDGWPVTECLIWLSMICGFDKITESNLQRVWQRVSQYETAIRPMNTNQRRIEPFDLRLRIGMRTNASTMTDAQWRKHLISLIDRETTDPAWDRTGGGTIRLASLDNEDTGE